MDKITSGDFGYCEGTGDPIPKKRLELAPWVRYSVEFLEQKEKIGKLHNRKSSILEDMTS